MVTEGSSLLAMIQSTDNACNVETDVTKYRVIIQVASLCRVTRGFDILCQIMVTFLSYISNACHSLSGVAERLQHTCGFQLQYGHVISQFTESLPLKWKESRLYRIERSQSVGRQRSRRQQ